jgi:hypothetical protein
MADLPAVHPGERRDPAAAGRLSLGDQVAVNALAALLVRVVCDRAREDEALMLLRGAIGPGSFAPEHPRPPPVARVIAAAEAVLAVAYDRYHRGETGWFAAAFAAQEALADFFRWRAAAAWDRLNPQPEDAADAAA